MKYKYSKPVVLFGICGVSVLMVFIFSYKTSKCPTENSSRERDELEFLSTANSNYLSLDEVRLFEKCAHSGNQVAVNELIEYYENYKRDHVKARYWSKYITNNH